MQSVSRSPDATSNRHVLRLSSGPHLQGEPLPGNHYGKNYDPAMNTPHGLELGTLTVSIIIPIYIYIYTASCIVGPAKAEAWLACQRRVWRRSANISCTRNSSRGLETKEEHIEAPR